MSSGLEYESQDAWLPETGSVSDMNGYEDIWDEYFYELDYLQLSPSFDAALNVNFEKAYPFLMTDVRGDEILRIESDRSLVIADDIYNAASEFWNLVASYALKRDNVSTSTLSGTTILKKTWNVKKRKVRFE